MENDQKRAFMAVGLSALVLILWQFYFAPKNEMPLQSNDISTKPSQTKVSQNTGNSNSQSVPDNSNEESVNDEINVNREFFQIENTKGLISFSNRIEINELYNSRNSSSFSEIVGESGKLKLFLRESGVNKELNFKLNTNDGKVYSGSDDSNGITVNITQTEKGLYSFNLQSSKPATYLFEYTSEPKELENTQVRRFIYLSTDTERISVGDTDAAEVEVSWFGLDFNHHLFATVFPKKENVKLQTTESNKMMIATTQATNNFSFELLFEKKNYDYLKTLGNNLDMSVDFGFFAILAVPLLKGLQMFYDMVPNYGIAIILLTLLVRLITFPLQFKSFKSMKKMQKIQPELTKLKEKHKDNPQKLQQETMALFKRSGANPLGGCFPMLLQMPIFFAFYKVLYAAVELVGAPFGFWLTDLSVKDPYYVLPVLMGIAFFLQQKLSPSTVTDPMQQKMFMIMPLVFGFIMKDLPSGLVLYILVSTVFGVAQQMLVYKMAD